MSPDELKSGFTLGEWTVLPSQLLLRRGDEEHRVEPKVMAVLVCLAAHSPDTATRETLLATVWKDVVVQDEVLSRNVSVLRGILDGPGGTRRFIETIPRTGYRLMVAVSPISAPRKPGRPIAMAVIIAVLVAIGTWQLLTRGNDEAAPTDYNQRLSEQLLLLGQDHVERRGEAFLMTSVRLFEDALAQDPSLREARLGLARALTLLPSYQAVDAAPLYARALVELDTFVEAGGDIERTYETRAFIAMQQMAWMKAEELFRLAIASQPDDANLHQWRSQFFSRVGMINASVSEAQRAVALGPDSPVANHRLGVARLWAGQNENAAQQFDRAAALGIAPFSNPAPRVILLSRMREFDEAASLVLAIQESTGGEHDWVGPVIAALAADAPVSGDAALDAVRKAWQRGAIDPWVYFGVPLLLGDAERALAAAFELLRTNRFAPVVEGLFLPEAKSLRALPAFQALARELALDSYWRTYGLPDTCKSPDPEPWCAVVMSDMATL